MINTLLTLERHKKFIQVFLSTSSEFIFDLVHYYLNINLKINLICCNFRKKLLISLGLNFKKKNQHTPLFYYDFSQKLPLKLKKIKN